MGIVDEPLGERAEPLGMHLKPLGHRHPQDDRRAPAAKPVGFSFGVRIANRAVESPVGGQFPARDVRRHWHGAEEIAGGGRGSLHDEAALGNPVFLTRRRHFESIEHARFVERAAVERALAHLHARHDVALRTHAVVDAQPPLPPLVAPEPHEQLRIVIRGEAGCVVDKHIGALDESLPWIDTEGRGCEGVAVGVEFDRGGAGTTGHDEEDQGGGHAQAANLAMAFVALHATLRSQAARAREAAIVATAHPGGPLAAFGRRGHGRPRGRHR